MGITPNTEHHRCSRECHRSSLMCGLARAMSAVSDTQAAQCTQTLYKMWCRSCTGQSQHSCGTPMVSLWTIYRFFLLLTDLIFLPNNSIGETESTQKVSSIFWPMVIMITHLQFCPDSFSLFCFFLAFKLNENADIALPWLKLLLRNW